MNVLVAHASRHGATAGIADRIAARLNELGMSAESRPVTDVSDPDRYDAFVVGSAAYMFHWLKEANRFMKRNRSLLAERPLWLFSSGPLGTDLVDADGQDVLVSARPKEFDELEATLAPRGTMVFFGALDRNAPPIGLAERFLQKLPANTEGLPEGDFRDWEAIDAWAEEIAAALRALPAPTS
jgi:menaquinone-dependent protoporphyrinogen oxidase